RQRKRILRQIRDQNGEARLQLEARFEAARSELIHFHEQRLAELKRRFVRAREELADQAFGAFTQQICAELDAYQRAYFYSFGNLQTTAARIAERQAAHGAALQSEAARRQARSFLLTLLEDVAAHGSTPEVQAVVHAMMQNVTSSRWL